jgi:hypothetical protein
MIYMGLPDDPQVLAAIGRIAIRHGQLYYHLKMTVRSLSGVTIDEAIDATERQGSRELRVRVRKLARKRLGESEALVRLDALLGRAARATERRNKLLHGLWAQELDGDAVLRTEGREFKPIPSVADLNVVADELAQIAKDLLLARLDGFLRDALSK